MRVRKKDTDFTNIRIHIKTHEELDAIGARGESMDDIVKKCLAAYRAQEPQLHFPQHQLQQQPQSQELQEQIPPPQQDNEVKKRSSQDTLQLPGIRFPATKDQIMESAKKGQYPVPRHMIPADVRHLIDDKKQSQAEKESIRKRMIGTIIESINLLPDKKYMTKSELEKAYTEIENKYGRNRIGKTYGEIYKGRYIVVIDDREIQEDKDKIKDRMKSQTSLTK